MNLNAPILAALLALSAGPALAGPLHAGYSASRAAAVHVPVLAGLQGLLGTAFGPRLFSRQPSLARLEKLDASVPDHLYALAPLMDALPADFLARLQAAAKTEDRAAFDALIEELGRARETATGWIERSADADELDRFTEKELEPYKLYGGRVERLVTERIAALKSQRVDQSVDAISSSLGGFNGALRAPVDPNYAAAVGHSRRLAELIGQTKTLPMDGGPLAQAKKMQAKIAEMMLKSVARQPSPDKIPALVDVIGRVQSESLDRRAIHELAGQGAPGLEAVESIGLKSKSRRTKRLAIKRFELLALAEAADAGVPGIDAKFSLERLQSSFTALVPTADEIRRGAARQLLASLASFLLTLVMIDSAFSSTATGGFILTVGAIVGLSAAAGLFFSAIQALSDLDPEKKA